MKRFPSARRAGSRTRPRKRIVVAPEIRAYVRKIDRYRAGRDPVPLMKQAPARFTRAVAGLNASQMRKRPARGKWSIVEILGHLQDTEFVYGWRIRLSLSQPGMPIQGYNQSVWAEELRHRRANAKRLLERIRTMREGTLETVAQVPRSRWKRYGWHSERGKESVRRVLELLAGHDLNHLDQIKAIRKKYRW